METAFLILLIITMILLGAVLYLLVRQRRVQEISNRELNQRMREDLQTFATATWNSLGESREQQNEQLEQLDHRLHHLTMQNDQRMENLRQEMDKQMRAFRDENSKQLQEMRETVDEKLQHTLENRLDRSFQTVNQSLEQVSKGLGEMQSLARGVGDLKKVLSNVKTRGILGEIQLGAILEEIMAPEQFVRNYSPKEGSREVVEFAVKLPGEAGNPVYLPIDSKFPGNRYQALVEAYEDGSPERVRNAQRELVSVLRSEAKDIRNKYIAPPATTDFGIMFLPSEGLYAEAVRLGMVEILQREYHVNMAGPTTMAALLNSLQTGFRTLAIQERSAEVWETLAAVKTEFGKFEEILRKTQDSLMKANDDLDRLIGVRTRAIERKLRAVTEIDSAEAARLIREE